MEMTKKVLTTAFNTLNILNVFNIYYNSGTKTITTGPGGDCVEHKYGYKVISIEGEPYDIGFSYINGFRMAEKYIDGFQVEPKRIRRQVFDNYGVVQFRYWGFYVPYIDKTYRQIYYINVLTD